MVCLPKSSCLPRSHHASNHRSAISVLVLGILLSLLNMGCLTGSPSGSTPEPSRVDALQALLDRLVRQDPSVPGIVLSVKSAEVQRSLASGAISMNGRPLQTTDLFRAASVTKTFVSAALFRLDELGMIDLQATIDVYLSQESLLALQQGGYDPSQISVAQLLNHTAGLFDYTEAPSFYATIATNNRYVWTRSEQLQLAMTEGQRLNAPGQAYHYGDTHYILAGEILERVTGKSLDAAFRSVLRFDQSGMADTFIEAAGSVTPDDVAVRMTHPYKEQVDTLVWDASWDLFGGGGIVTTTEDLMRFFTALFDTSGAGIFSDPGTLERMLAMPEVGLGGFFGIDGGYGINRFTLDNGVACYGAFGYFSTLVVNCPAAGIQLAATENQSDPQAPDALLDGVLEILLR